jgi:hypothetical protein
MQLHESVYPFEDHLKLTNGYISADAKRIFGAINRKTVKDWMEERSSEIQKLVSSKVLPWALQGANYGNMGDIEDQEIFSKWTTKEKQEHYPKLLAKYNEAMLTAENEEQKIKLIAQHMQDIECLHFFTDGNCRVVYLLTNKELMKHGIDPVILFNPNDFEQMTLDDLYIQIKIGQRAFQNLITINVPYEDCLDQETIFKNIKSLNH